MKGLSSLHSSLCSSSCPNCACLACKQSSYLQMRTRAAFFWRMHADFRAEQWCESLDSLYQVVTEDIPLVEISYKSLSYSTKHTLVLQMQQPPQKCWGLEDVVELLSAHTTMANQVARDEKDLQWSRLYTCHAATRVLLMKSAARWLQTCYVVFMPWITACPSWCSWVEVPAVFPSNLTKSAVHTWLSLLLAWQIPVPTKSTSLEISQWPN